MGVDTKLCNLAEISDGHSGGFVVDTADGRCGLLVVRRGNTAVSYVNSCPHIGTPLEIRPNHFLDQEGKYILCSTHGALFQIDDGLCIAGPCVDDKLTAIDIEVKDGALFVDSVALPTIWPPRIEPPFHNR